MSTADTTRGQAVLSLLSCMDNNAVQVDSHIVSKITSDLPVTSIDQSVWNIFKGLDLANPSFHQPNKIDLLLSCDVMLAMIKNEKIQCGHVIVQNATFGWVIGVRTTNHHNIVDIDKQLKRFWELEELSPSAKRLSHYDCVPTTIQTSKHVIHQFPQLSQSLKGTRSSNDMHH
jgi:hypothetical protein